MYQLQTLLLTLQYCTSTVQMFLVIVVNTANTEQNTKPIKTLFSLPFLNKLHSVYNIFVVRSIGTAYIFQVTLKFKMTVNCLVACTLEKKSIPSQDYAFHHYIRKLANWIGDGILTPSARYITIIG